MIMHPYRPRGCNPGAPPNIKEMPGHLGHKGRAENTQAVNLNPEFSTAQCWHVSSISPEPSAATHPAGSGIRLSAFGCEPCGMP